LTGTAARAPRTVRVASLQLAAPASTTDTAIAGRVDTVARQIAELDGVDLVVLPEMWPSGYFSFDDYDRVAQPLDGPVVCAIARSAARLGAYVVGGSFVERLAGGGLANTTFVATPTGDVIAAYRKIHVFGYQSRETELITHGQEVVTVATDIGRIGLAICYDLRFPELFRALVDEGADIVVIPAAWPLARVEHWRLLSRARAVENQTFVVTCNGAGSEHGTALGGHSAVIDPRGEILAEAGADPEVLRAALDLADLDGWRAAFPVLADRRLATTLPEVRHG
jgi:predicted amidohydrolase